MARLKLLLVPAVLISALLLPMTSASADLPNKIRAHIRLTHVFRSGTDLTARGKAIYTNNRPHKNAVVSCEVELHEKVSGTFIGQVEVTRHVPADSTRVTKWTIEGTSSTSDVIAHRHNCHLV